MAGESHPSILRFEHISVSFDGETALSDVSFEAFEGESRVFWFDGNYSEYEEDKRKRLGVEAAQPHRIHYRQLTR